MVLGIGSGELLLLVGAGILVIGPKDLPFAARVAGRAAGRAVAYVSAFRKQALSFAEDTEITKLHEELQQSLQQLQAIRSELQSGVNIFNPGPVARKLMSNGGGQPAKSAKEPSQRLTESEGKSRVASTPVRPTGGIDKQQFERLDRGTADFLLKEQKDGSMSPMPISAVLTRRLPKREGDGGTGADIMMDALAEEEIAHAAQHFLDALNIRIP